jgi:hypothetical protein
MYDNFIDVNEKFKASVNLEYDLLNEEKIMQYVPTTDLCDVLKSYIKSFIFGAQFNSTILSGPYGKGKSFLILMLIYLMSKHDNAELFNSVLKKIKLIDLEMFEMLQKMEEDGIYLYPVIINNNSFEDINKSFLLALNNTLRIYGLEDIIPNTTFKECLSIIERWEQQTSNGFDVRKCLKKITLEELKAGLKRYDYEAYKEFSDLYTCVSQGLEFFSMKSDDIVGVFSDVVNQLIKKDNKCRGLFVVFDEFGSFLNSQTNDFASKLNKIQSFAESANASTLDRQLHLCCITHKDILLYKKEKNYSDAFQTIAGRFKQLRFDRSLDENYQIICSALLKKEGYNELNNQLKEKYQDVLNKMSEIGIFALDQLDYIIDNGLPFNPITIYSLIQVSEKIAQNERTLFTFLSDKDVDGFRHFISNDMDALLNIDKIYNYFVDLIKDSEEYKMLYYKVESLINNSLKNEEHIIFKAIAIFKIIGDDVRFNCTINNISLSLAMTEVECLSIINPLIENNILKRNINDDSIDFAIIADDEINKMINNESELRFNNIDLSQCLTEINPNKYEFSNKYNFSYHMVRFFKIIFLETSKLYHLNSFDGIFDEYFHKEVFDGLIINLINDAKFSQEQIRNILTNSKPNIIVKYVSTGIDKEVVSKIKNLLSSRYLLSKGNNFSESVVKALPILIDDLTEELNVFISNKYGNARCLCSCNFKEKNLKNCMYLSLRATYPNTIIFNNEQVNKNIVPAVTIKARNNIIEHILNQSEFGYSQTSQEMTIKNAFDDSNKTEVVNYIKNTLIKNIGIKTCFADLVNSLKESPYGIRDGIMPLLFAEAISQLSIITDSNIDTVILYNESVELDLNSNNLSRAVLNPSKHYFYFTNLNGDKLRMIENLCQLFDCSNKAAFSEQVKELIRVMKLKVSSLEPVIIKSNNIDNILNLSAAAIYFKDEYLKLNTNNYELLFNISPSILKCTIGEMYQKIKNIMDEYNEKYNAFANVVVEKTKNCFSEMEGSLKSVIDNWCKSNPIVNDIVFDKKEKKIYESLKELSFDDQSALNKISISSVNCAIADWNLTKYNQYFENLNGFIHVVKNFDQTKALTTKQDFALHEYENLKLSSLGNTLYSNILEAVEEYGDAITNEEKALIFKKILGELL